MFHIKIDHFSKIDDDTLEKIKDPHWRYAIARDKPAILLVPQLNQGANTCRRLLSSFLAGFIDTPLFAFTILLLCNLSIDALDTFASIKYFNKQKPSLFYTMLKFYILKEAYRGGNNLVNMLQHGCKTVCCHFRLEHIVTPIIRIGGMLTLGVAKAVKWKQSAHMILYALSFYSIIEACSAAARMNRHPLYAVLRRSKNICEIVGNRLHLISRLCLSQETPYKTFSLSYGEIQHAHTQDTRDQTHYFYNRDHEKVLVILKKKEDIDHFCKNNNRDLMPRNAGISTQEKVPLSLDFRTHKSINTDRVHTSLCEEDISLNTLLKNRPSDTMRQQLLSDNVMQADKSGRSSPCPCIIL